MSETRAEERSDLAKWYAAANCVVLVLVGLLGFVENPIVGMPEWNPIFTADMMHNVVHVATGLLAFFIAFGLSGNQRANGLIGFGVLYALILIVGVVSPDMFGLMDMAPMNAADHVLHLVLAGGALAVGFASRSSTGVRRTA
jgi:hypothetical protein